jgi:hypothetical protein
MGKEKGQVFIKNHKIFTNNEHLIALTQTLIYK